MRVNGTTPPLWRENATDEHQIVFEPTQTAVNNLNELDCGAITIGECRHSASNRHLKLTELQYETRAQCNHPCRVKTLDRGRDWPIHAPPWTFALERYTIL